MTEGSFGARLRRARRNAGLSQTDLASKSGIRKSALSRYENDHILPSLHSLGRLASALGVDRTELLPGERSGVEALCEELSARGITFTPGEAPRLADMIATDLIRRATGSADTG